MAEEQVSLRQSAAWGAMAFGVALAVIIGVRLDQAALAAVVGVVCGVGSSIPTSLLIVSLLRRQDARDERRMIKAKQREIMQSSPVVVVASPATPQLHQSSAWSEQYATPLPAQRRFSIIGEDESEGLE